MRPTQLAQPIASPGQPAHGVGKRTMRALGYGSTTSDTDEAVTCHLDLDMADQS